MRSREAIEKIEQNSAQTKYLNAMAFTDSQSSLTSGKSAASRMSASGKRMRNQHLEHNRIDDRRVVAVDVLPIARTDHSSSKSSDTSAV